MTKRREVAGRISGAIPFTYGPLAYLLKNRTYIGETGHNGSWFKGEHEPIVDRSTFEQVQTLLKSNSAGRTGRRERTGALLTGLVYDDQGNRMSPSYSVKNGVRYPFYISSALLRGRKGQAGTLPRVSATEIEAAVLMAVRAHTDEQQGAGLTPRELIELKVARIVVSKQRISVSTRDPNGAQADPIEIPWNGQGDRPCAPIDGDNQGGGAGSPDPALVQALVRAHVWLKQLSDETYSSIEELAAAAKIHPKVVRNRIRLAYLSPNLTRAILHGDNHVSTLAELNSTVPLGWHEQEGRMQSKSD